MNIKHCKTMERVFLMVQAAYAATQIVLLNCFHFFHTDR